jgi:hypothetical protein
MLAAHAKCLKEHIAEKSLTHAAELDALKHSHMETQNIFAKNITPYMHDYKVAAAHYASMTKASETLFDGKSENWPKLKKYLI